jgi:hypothetical protein
MLRNHPLHGLGGLATLLLPTLLLSQACVGRKPKPPVATSVPAPAASAPASGPEAGHGQNRASRDDAAVVVDGREVAVLRHGELPPGVPMVASPTSAQARYFRVADYLGAIGVDVGKVRAVHFLGNRGRVASIEGVELRREPKRFVFDFTRTTEGSPAVMWDTTGLRNTKRIDLIRGVVVFASSEPRAVDLAKGCYPTATGECDDEAVQEPAHGTRVYVDGRVVANIKRKQLGDGTGTSASSLLDALRAAGVATSSLRGVEIVADDAVVARAVGADLGAHLAAVKLEGTRGGRGRAVATVPAELVGGGAADGPAKARVEAVVAYRRVPTPVRPLAPFPAASDEPLAARVEERSSEGL